MNTFILWKCMLFRKHARICARAASLRMRPLRCIQPFSRPSSELTAAELVIRPKEAFVNLYWQLECGEFWFPGQVFSREHGHVEFMMSCYDADLKYDRNSDTFCASHQETHVRLQGPRIHICTHVPWYPHPLVPAFPVTHPILQGLWLWRMGYHGNVLGIPIVTSPSELYIPDVPEELRPGDHIEVQWKRSPSLPYGWWYGMVGHGDNCQSENQNCRCHLDEMVWLEFRQYATSSRWRRTRIRRNRAPEIGSKLDGIYGGIRKLNNKEDISAWLQMWPKEPL